MPPRNNGHHIMLFLPQNTFHRSIYQQKNHQLAKNQKNNTSLNYHLVKYFESDNYVIETNSPLGDFIDEFEQTTISLSELIDKKETHYEIYMILQAI